MFKGHSPLAVMHDEDDHPHELAHLWGKIRRMGLSSREKHPERAQAVAGPSTSGKIARKLGVHRTLKRCPVPVKEPPAPTRIHFTLLPPEIWILIFREATMMTPDPTCTDEAHSFLTAPSLRYAAHRRSMRAKRAISLTNSRFRLWVESFLYEMVWIRRGAQAKALAHTLLASDFVDGVPAEFSPGRYIRHLHIETPTLDRCAPDDVRTILAYAPQLRVYTDNHSVRRNRYDPLPDPRCAPDKLFALLAHPNNELRRLAWTTYDDIPFHLDMSPLLQSETCRRLEYLELSSWSAFDSPHQAHAVAAMVHVTLPALRSLKVSLDNTTFAVLAGWAMPLLTNLSVVSSDFSYAGDGFSEFFHQHGAQIEQLELGHSSSQISEHHVNAAASQHAGELHQRLKLAEWCPNLTAFICSADAEWNWLTPDWIAPHVLLPAHPTLEFIAIRDIDTRLLVDGGMPVHTAGYARASAHAVDTTDPAPFFPLLEQLASLLRDDAFPALRYVRDLSEESHRMRTVRPQPRVTRFWERVVLRCSEKGVWLEDWEGVNVTLRGLKRASMLLE